MLIYHFDRRKLSIEIGIRADIPFCCILRNFRSELWIGTTALVPVINYFISGPRIISTHIPIYNLYLQRIGIETGISSDVPFINCKFSGKKVVKFGISADVPFIDCKFSGKKVVKFGISADIPISWNSNAHQISLKWYIFRYTNFTDKLSAMIWYMSCCTNLP